MLRRLTLVVGCALAALVVSAAAGADGSVGADCVKPLDLTSWYQDLSNCNLKDVTVSGGTSLYGSNLSGANLSGATVDTAYKTLSYANLSGANLNGATIGAMEGDNLTGANLHGATILQSALRMANLTDANLNGATVAASALSSAIYNNTTCPDGTNSDDNSGTCVGHGVP